MTEKTTLIFQGSNSCGNYIYVTCSPHNYLMGKLKHSHMYFFPQKKLLQGLRSYLSVITSKVSTTGLWNKQREELLSGSYSIHSIVCGVCCKRKTPPERDQSSGKPRKGGSWQEQLPSASVNHCECPHGEMKDHQASRAAMAINEGRTKSEKRAWWETASWRQR